MKSIDIAHTLVSRISRILQEGLVKADHVLALTFTRKATLEMQHRVTSTIQPREMSRGLTVSTFHQLALRILRDCYLDLGFRQQFQVFGADEQHEVIKVSKA